MNISATNRLVVPAFVVLGAAVGLAVGIGSLWWFAPLPAFATAVVAVGRDVPRARRATSAAVVCATVAALAGGLIYPDADSGAVNSAVVGLVLALLALGVGAWRSARLLQHDELARGWALARALEAERASSLAVAVSSERSAMAGQIHDRLGHRLSYASVRLGRLWLDPGLTAEQREAIEGVRGELAEITDEIGTTVRLLDSGQASPQLARDPNSVLARARAAGCDIRADLLAAEAANPLARDALGRVLEETLANAVRHAVRAPVTVATGRDDDFIVLTVSNPRTENVTTGGSGTGLARLNDRVEHLGGTMRVTSGEEFTVEVRLPVDPWLHPTTDTNR